jgi:hypothetical protein
MKFFYADALDLVDPQFDFLEEKSRKTDRVPQRDDVYAHEIMNPRPYDGLLVSKSMFRVSGGSVAGGKYSFAQRHRFLREGAQRFLRFPADGDYDPEIYPIMGDCGAFAYRDEKEPPYTIEELVEFYEFGGFTHGIALDHLILQYNPDLDESRSRQSVLPGTQDAMQDLHDEVRRRKELTLENASSYLKLCCSENVRFEPVGSAQGWSPASYRDSVRALITMGYKYIAIGGLIPLKNNEIRTVLDGIKAETNGHTRLHLLGVTRLGELASFQDAGVVSFDSSSPILRSFKDARDNYFSSDPNGHYTAIRVPQADGPRMMMKIREGIVAQDAVVRGERRALRALRRYDSERARLDEVMEALRVYDELSAGRSKTRWPWMERTLRDQPWKKCSCSVCRQLGIEVVVFRGANRNRRRGFHNLWWTHEQLRNYRSESEE